MPPKPLENISPGLWHIIIDHLGVKDLFALELAFPQLTKSITSSLWRKMLFKLVIPHMFRGRSVDWKWEAICRTYFTELPNRKSNESVLFSYADEHRGDIIRMHMNQGATRLLATANTSKEFDFYIVDEEHSRVRHLHRNVVNRFPRIYPFDSFDDTLAVAGDWVEIWKPSDSMVLAHSVYQKLDNHRSPCFLDQHTLLTAEFSKGIQLIDLREDYIHPEKPFIEARNIVKMHAVLCNTSVGQLKPVKNQPSLVEDSTSSVESITTYCASQAGASCATTSAKMVSISMNEINYWDLRNTKCPLTNWSFENELCDTALGNGSDLWVLQPPNKLTLVDVNQDHTTNKSVELDNIHPYHLEASGHSIFLNDTANILSFHATWPITRIQSDEPIANGEIISNYCLSPRDHTLAIAYMNGSLEVLAPERNSMMYNYLFSF